MPLTAEERARLIDRYAAGPECLRAALVEVPEEARRWRPDPGEWSVHEIVVHCGDSETTSVGRIRYLLAEPEPLILGYDQEAWAARLDYHSLPLEPALAATAAVRANTVPLLRRMTAAQWERAGRHSESGAYAAEDWLRIYAAHLEEHARQIAGNLAAWRARPER